MPRTDRRIDAYIAKSAPFARPILAHLRAVVHAACPGVNETIKWGMPAFEYAGPLCSMAAFKQHATFGFWKGALIVDPGTRKLDEAMGDLGRLTRVADLPSRRVLTSWIKQAMKLNEEGVKAPPRKAPAPRKPLPVPADLRAALAGNRRAAATFAAFAPGHRREYIEWIVEAKQEATRERRLEQAIEWLAEGKERNWKYRK